MGVRSGGASHERIFDFKWPSLLYAVDIAA
jgi:hypothetical protein